MKNCTIQTMKGIVDGTFCGDRLAIVDNVAPLSPIKGVYRIGLFVIFLVKSGKVELTVDDNDYELGPNDMFVFNPNAVLDRFNVSMSADVTSLCVSLDYMTTLAGKYPQRADVMLLLSRKPHIKASATAVDNMTTYLELLRRKFMEMNSTLNERIVMELVITSMCELVGAMDTDPDIIGGYTSADNIFRKFLQLLDSEKPRGRRVDEYAHKLNITPKYLSSICRRKSGMTAIQVINKAVLGDILEELRDDTKSVRQVALELEFPNQSFFGTFLKKHTWMSPLQFRSRRLKKA